MNTKNIFFLLPGLALALAACSENSWNDKLDGFEQPPVNSTVTTKNYALTTADYQKIASLPRNKAIAEAAGKTDELAAIGSNGCFQTAEQARLYIPAFLRDSTSTTGFFALNDRSSVAVTYNLESDLPEIVKEINAGVSQYTVSEADYQQAWGSDDDFISAFAPMTPAAGSLPAILKNALPSAAEGQYAVVTYNQSAVNPVFGSVSGGGDTPAWEPSSVLGAVAVGDHVDVKGYITALCTRGFIVADAAGAIFCYQSSGFDASAFSIGDQVELGGDVSAYGTGLQIAVSADSYTVVGSGAFNYPAPIAYTGPMMDEAVARSGDFAPIYCSIVGKVSISGNYYNFIVDGAENAQGSVYYATDATKAQLADGQTYTLTGYFTAVSGGRYFNMIITDIQSGTKAGARPRFAPVGEVATTQQFALYRFDGAKWTVPSNTYVIQPADYTAMGQNYGNFSGSGAETYLPLFLKQQYPYAQTDAVVTVAYKYYDGSTTAYKAAQYTFDGAEWIRNAGQTTDKFTRLNGFWNYNPSVELTLPYARNTDPSYTYYMACVRWVLENVVKPIQPDATLTTAEYYIDYRGNAEFYSGASAYYGNVDVRAASARNNAPEGAYDGMSDEQIVTLLKKRFSTQVLPGALKELHPDAKPVDGMNVTYTINFTAYDGSSSAQTIVYTVTAPGTFTYTSSTWADGQDADW